VLYKVIADHLETFLASLDAAPDATGGSAYTVRNALYALEHCHRLSPRHPWAMRHAAHVWRTASQDAIPEHRSLSIMVP
jgi:hypothetical protein